jgi:hypothetical protein
MARPMTPSARRRMLLQAPATVPAFINANSTHASKPALGIMQAVPGEDFRLTGLPLSFDGERPAIRGPAPRLGADTARHLLP